MSPEIIVKDRQISFSYLEGEVDLGDVYRPHRAAHMMTSVAANFIRQRNQGVLFKQDSLRESAIRALSVFLPEKKAEEIVDKAIKGEAGSMLLTQDGESPDTPYEVGPWTPAEK